MPSVPPNTAPAVPPPVPPRIDSRQILAGGSAVEIVHCGQLYVLRVTRENKLLLTK